MRDYDSKYYTSEHQEADQRIREAQLGTNDLLKQVLQVLCFVHKVELKWEREPPYHHESPNGAIAHYESEFGKWVVVKRE